MYTEKEISNLLAGLLSRLVQKRVKGNNGNPAHICLIHCKLTLYDHSRITHINDCMEWLTCNLIMCQSYSCNMVQVHCKIKDQLQSISYSILIHSVSGQWLSRIKTRSVFVWATVNQSVTHSVINSVTDTKTNVRLRVTMGLWMTVPDWLMPWWNRFTPTGHSISGLIQHLILIFFQDVWNWIILDTGLCSRRRVWL